MLLAAASNSAVYTFTAYLAVVMLLAWASNRLMRSKSFLSEYFLGSRSLGTWAFALTFAATSSSGGSFIGFPALVYTHGWIVALWIGSYMIVPMVSMGLLAKRINQMARKTGAITVPDVLRDRFESPAFGILATMLIVFFMVFNLVAQFKGGSVILQTLLSDVPLFIDARDAMAGILQDVPLFSAADPGYVICLLVFVFAVVVYTTYGGFRAVVWTDVMQGFVMVAGVLIMLPLAIIQVGGLTSATERMAEMTPPTKAVLKLSPMLPDREDVVPANTIVYASDDPFRGRRMFRTAERAEVPAFSLSDEQATDDPPFVLIDAIEIVDDKDRLQLESESPRDWFKTFVVTIDIESTDPIPPGSYVTGPGPSASSSDGFLPLALAVSFFFMWTFSGAGQPSNMVRLMAFNSSRTLRRAIFTVTVYYSLIYFPLVIIFCCARVLLPGWETEPDRIMPEMAHALTEGAGVPWLAGLLVAAPFAAVMSTMDSFLLMISSAMVRDVYQRNFRPDATERTLKRLTYTVTIIVGVSAMLIAVAPPLFLQDIIIFTGSGLSTSFLVPVFLALYWPRFNTPGAFAGMLSGFCMYTLLYGIGLIQTGEMQPYQLLNFHPFLVAMLFSLLMAIAVTLLTPPPDERLVRKFFTTAG